MIFVLGSGRSGTHWLGHILASHPDLAVTIEDSRWFSDVTEMALDPSVRAGRFAKLVGDYRAEATAVAPRQFVDKSHPNLWLADDLAAAIPSSRFVGIQRDPWGTIASMLEHPGVLSWHGRWREFPVPNAFLGVSAEDAPNYDDYSIATKCALRWRSHATEMSALRQRLGGRLHVVSYGDLFTQPDRELRTLADHLHLDRPFPAVEPKAASLERWREVLRPDQLEDIAAVVGFEPAALPGAFG